MATTMTRQSVLVNTRYNVPHGAQKSASQSAMADDWYNRFVKAIQDDGRDLKAISLAAHCGPNYVQQMIKDGKRPGVDKFLAILNVLGSASALYVLTGLEMTAEDEAFFRAVAKLDPELKAEAYRFFQKLQASSDRPEQSPGSQD